MTIFQKTDDLAEWMQDEGFDELVLLSCKPTPKAPKPATARKTKALAVVIEVGIVDIEHHGPKDRFHVWRVEAHDVVRWEAGAALDKQVELTLDRAADVDAPIALRLIAGGVALLACGRVDVVDAGPRLRAARPRTWQHDLNFYLHGDTTVGAMLEAVGAPGAHLQSCHERPLRAEAAWTLTSLNERTGGAWQVMDGERDIAAFGASSDLPHWLLSLQRGSDATDDEWDRCWWTLPIRLSRDEVWSRTVKKTKDEWSTIDWRKGLPQPSRDG